MTTEDHPVPAADLPDFDAMTDEAFRLQVRSFVEENYPPELRHPPRRLHWPTIRPWYLTLSRKGWLAPAWPRSHGGMGLSAAKQLIMIEEYERHGVARMPDLGLVLLAPLLIKHGTAQQQEYFLPRMLSGEDVWCQGYSEPEAGSDLASLRTRAVLEDGHWIVNGQKIWTSMAMDAGWIFLLVRTNPTARKQDGISFLLVRMDSPGITVKPIANLDLNDEFCEVFFDNVKVPAGNLVGQLDRGWHMAKDLLGFERILVGSPRQSENAMERLTHLAEKLGVLHDPAFRERYIRLKLDLADHVVFYTVFYDKVRRGETIGPEISMLKINQTELFQRISAVMLEIANEYGGLLDPLDDEAGLHPSGTYLQALPSTIYGGSSEIQRNIIARNVLGLA